MKNRSQNKSREAEGVRRRGIFRLPPNPSPLTVFLLAPVFWLLAPVFWAPARAQEQPPPVIRAEVNLVNVIFTVTDKRGNQIHGLKKEGFEVYEDGVRQEISYFANHSGREATPLTIALLIDTSGSEKNKLGVLKDTAALFIKNILRPHKDLACIIQFDSEVNLVHDLTDDAERLISALESLRAGNSTSLYDAIYLAVREKLSREAGRRVIVVLSDGEDTSSKVKKQEAIEEAQRADVVIYGIGIRDPLFFADFGVLKDFARETGGRFFEEKADFTELERAFQQIGEDIKGQYSLGYVSSNQKRDGSYRKIVIKHRNKAYRINHRRGYYAPKS